MPCYTAWYFNYTIGSTDFEEERNRLIAKFIALKHIVDYYFTSAQKPLPCARYAGTGEVNYKLVGIDQFTEGEYDTLCKHMACDEVHHTELLDIESLINRDNEDACKYAYVLVQCLLRLRGDSKAFYLDPNVEKVKEASWFIYDPHEQR